MSYPQIIIILKIFRDFSPAKLSLPKTTIILEIFKDFFACKFVLAPNLHYPENIQKFFACKIVLSANHHYSENIQRLFPLPKCLERKSSLSSNYSKTFSPAKLSWAQIIIILKTFKHFFAFKIVLAANHHYPETIQRLFRLQNCLRRKSSLSWKYSRTFSPAKLSWAQIIIILKTFKHFFAFKIVLAANHHYPETIQRLFRLQNCLRRKSSLSWKYSKTFSPAKFS